MPETTKKDVRTTNPMRAAIVSLGSIAVYALLILYHIASYDYNLSCMIRFGAANPFFYSPALEPNLVVFDNPESGGAGYDGQFYYFIVKDFFMGEEGRPNPFRSQRILYPFLVHVFALGQADLLPLSMPAVNLLAIAVSAMFMWQMVRDTSIRAEVLLVYTLNIGFLIAVFYDIATPLCVGLVVAGAYFYRRKMLRPAALMFALAMLTQENAILVIGGLSLWLAWERNYRGAFVIALSILPWALWQCLLWQRYGRLPPALMSGGHFAPPLVGMVLQTASLKLPGDFIGNLRELSVYPFMLFLLLLLVVGISEMRKRPSAISTLLVVHALAGICFNKEQIWGSTITSPARALATVFPFIVLSYARDRTKGLCLLIVACVMLSLMGIFRILFLPVHPFYVTE